MIGAKWMWTNFLNSQCWWKKRLPLLIWKRSSLVEQFTHHDRHLWGSFKVRMFHHYVVHQLCGTGNACNSQLDRQKSFWLDLIHWTCNSMRIRSMDILHSKYLNGTTRHVGHFMFIKCLFHSYVIINKCIMNKNGGFFPQWSCWSGCNKNTSY